jgi:hypothetical protein
MNHSDACSFIGEARFSVSEVRSRTIPPKAENILPRSSLRNFESGTCRSNVEILLQRDPGFMPAVIAYGFAPSLPGRDSFQILE